MTILMQMIMFTRIFVVMVATVITLTGGDDGADVCDADNDGDAADRKESGNSGDVSVDAPTGGATAIRIRRRYFR